MLILDLIKVYIIRRKIINNFRSKHDCIIGIHARRADYATYLGGIHYHPWESYLTWAKETKKLLEEEGKQNIGVIICSDEAFHLRFLKKNSFTLVLVKKSW